MEKIDFCFSKTKYLKQKIGKIYRAQISPMLAAVFIQNPQQQWWCNLRTFLELNFSLLLPSPPSNCSYFNQVVLFQRKPEAQQRCVVLFFQNMSFTVLVLSVQNSNKMINCVKWTCKPKVQKLPHRTLVLWALYLLKSLDLKYLVY